MLAVTDTLVGVKKVKIERGHALPTTVAEARQGEDERAPTLPAAPPRKHGVRGCPKARAASITPGI